MKKEIVGIVAEFNPLHIGHKRLIDIARKENPNSIIVVAMSGEFVQRGELAIYNKWTRAEAALDFGVDLVIEIPPFFVLNNANIFASKAMEIFGRVGVNKVYFGTESISIEEIDEIVNLIENESDRLESLKKEFHSLPKAFSKFIQKEIQPNDTLGICYALESKKMGLSFSFNIINRVVNKEWPSASQIRENISNCNIDNMSLINSSEFRSLDLYSDIIIGKIITTETDNDVIRYLSNELNKNKPSSFTELIDNANNKNFTKSKLRRETLKFVLELEGGDSLIVLATNNNGKDILRDMDSYEFRHSKDNIDNYKVEKFINIKSKETLEELLSKSALIK